MFTLALISAGLFVALALWRLKRPAESVKPQLRPVEPDGVTHFYQFQLGILGADKVPVQPGSVDLEQNRGNLKSLLKLPVTYFYGRHFSGEAEAIAEFTAELSKSNWARDLSRGEYKVIYLLVWWDRPLPTDSSILEIIPELALSPSNVSVIFPAQGGITAEDMVLLFPYLMPI
jgi:hypothetical protein